MKVVLERYHGLSNDYVVFDPNKNELALHFTKLVTPPSHGSWNMPTR